MDIESLLPLKGSLPPRRMHCTATDRSTMRLEDVSSTGSFMRVPRNGSTYSSGSFSPISKLKCPFSRVLGTLRGKCRWDLKSQRST